MVSYSAVLPYSSNYCLLIHLLARIAFFNPPPPEETWAVESSDCPPMLCCEPGCVPVGLCRAADGPVKYYVVLLMSGAEPTKILIRPAHPVHPRTRVLPSIIVYVLQQLNEPLVDTQQLVIPATIICTCQLQCTSYVSPSSHFSVK